MSNQIQAAVLVFLLGGALGVGGYHLYQTQVVDQAATTIEPAKSSTNGLTTQPVPQLGLVIQRRPTDQIAVIQGENKESVGMRVFDPLAGDVNTAPHVDIITVRQAKLYDQPEAKTLDEYKKPTVAGLEIKETKEITIADHAAIKQLYQGTVDVPGPFGSTQQQPIAGLRWVVEREPGTYVVLRSTVESQGLLDLVAQQLTFIPIQAASQSSAGTTNTALDGSTLGGTNDAVDISGATLTPQNGATDSSIKQNTPSSSAIPIQP